VDGEKAVAEPRSKRVERGAVILIVGGGLVALACCYLGYAERL